MTPKQKAEELVLKFKKLPLEDTLAWYLSFELSKQCALIAVDELIIEESYRDGNAGYWQQVKQEIENL